MSKQTQNTIYLDRGGGIIYTEFFLCAVLLSIATVKFFTLPWAIGVAIFLPYVLVLDFLFFNFFLWRWAFILLMSLGWAVIAFLFTCKFADSNTWIITIATFVFMLWIHFDEFKFQSNATVSIFDYLGNCD